MARPRIARVIVNLALDRTFDYRVPPALADRIHVGSKVRVPFGKQEARDGYVVALAAHSEYAKPKDILDVIGDRELLPEPLVRLGEWMADYYCCSREQAIHALLPAVVRRGEVGPKTRQVVRLAEGVDPAAALTAIGARAPRQAEVIKVLTRTHQCSQSFLTRETGIGHASIKSLAADGWIVIEEDREERDPFSGATVLPSRPLELEAEQAAALAMIRASIEAPKRETILLQGVTGSGKTEVYLQAIAACLEGDLEAIVLVPEIALTPQTVDVFRGRFGDRVSVLHSHLGEGERFDEWTKINEGRVKIVVGARSALFAPFRRLGLIVVDEEHEGTYKQDKSPRYQARDVAVMRGRLENVTVVLGTATPSLESARNAALGKYRRACLRQRVDGRPMPLMECVDMTAEAAACGQPQIMSRRLRFCIEEALENGEQIMLFLNRRGYATQLQCLKCGYVAECPDCSLNYTYHRGQELLICHMCGSLAHAPERCPSCGDAEIRYSGLGTQKVETVVRGLFPQARLLRMDSDTMTRKHAYREAMSAFRSGAVNILIGTQMIAKGLHFPNVTVVGIIHADRTLNLPDIRSGERTFQLIVQVAGRAGRGDTPGRVIVQTYTPYHETLQAALTMDFDAFYESEIAVRETLQYPPATHMTAITFRGPGDEAVRHAAEQFDAHLTPSLPAGCIKVPPLPAPIPRKRGEYHYQLVLYTTRVASLSRRLKHAVNTFTVPKDIAITVDVDAYSLL